MAKICVIYSIQSVPEYEFATRIHPTTWIFADYPFPIALQPHHLPGTSRPSNPHNSSHPIQSHGSSQPHGIEDLDVQEDERFRVARQKWRALMENICNPIKSQDIPLPTSSRGASQVGQPHTTSQIAQPQTTSQVQLPHGSRRLTQSNASRTPSRNSSQPQDEDVDENCELDDDPITECEVGIAGRYDMNQMCIFWSWDDIYSQVIPTREWHGRIPGCGFGPTPKSSGSTCSASPRFNVADEEERMRDKETIHKLEDMAPLIRLLHTHIKDHRTQVMTSNVLMEVIGRSS